MRSGREFDLVIVGSGIIGSATALRVRQRLPGSLRVALLDKEARPGLHQSGRNSGVVHMGLYYKPNSLKAKLCLQGAQKAFEYFNTHNIPFKRCGKVVVAVEDSESERLHNLYQNSLTNGVPEVKMISSKELLAIEPTCKGIAAIHSPNTSIVDWGLVTRSFCENYQQMSGTFINDFEVSSIKCTATTSDASIDITSSKGVSLRTKYILSCCGLQSDKVAMLSGGSPDPRIVPIRGEYLMLSKSHANLVRGNIYPVPNPKYPFLGVHFTPRMDGSIWLGPNAVLASSREGYSYTDIDPQQVMENVLNPGFLKFAIKNAVKGVDELLSSVFISRQISQLQKYVPSLPGSAVRRVSAGVRAQAMDDEGNLVDDFVFDSGSSQFSGRVLHVRNAPSPGATSSLAIADYLIDKMRNDFNSF